MKELLNQLISKYRQVDNVQFDIDEGIEISVKKREKTHKEITDKQIKYIQYLPNIWCKKAIYNGSGYLHYIRVTPPKDYLLNFGSYTASIIIDCAVNNPNVTFFISTQFD